MQLTKTGLVHCADLDRYLTWNERDDYVRALERELVERKRFKGQIKEDIEREKRRRDRLSVPDGFASWEELKNKLIETRQLPSQETPYPWCIQPEVCKGKSDCPRKPSCGS